MMPKTLRKLKFVGDGDFFVSPDLENLSFRKYVPRLESFELRGRWGDSQPNMDEMPSSLRTLICAGWSASTPLPASLTHLELSYATSTSFLSNLPSSLTFLSLPKTPLTDFPTHLQQLESLTCQWKNTWEKLSELPKSLLKLKLLEELPWTSSAPTSSLPPGLTSLEMDNLPTQYWSYLPVALKSLDIRKDPTNDFFRELKRPEKTRQVATYPLENLPKSLLRLSIGFRFDFKNPHHLCAPSESVSSPSKELLFPPSLQYLRISSMPMSVEAGKQLPRSLTFLSTSFLHNAICEHLPRGLLELEATSCAVNQDFIKLLPKSITKLHLGFIDPTTRWYVMGTGTTSNTEVLFGITEEAMQQTFQDFWEFESCFSNLCKLSLSGCTISMNGLFSKHAKFGRLEKLILDRCRFLTPA